MNEGFSLDDGLRAARRQAAWLAGPLLAGLVMGVVTAFLWPDTFVSVASVRVTSPRLSETVAPRVFNDQLNDHLNQLANEVLSRTSLASLIETHGLYARDRTRRPLEDVVEEMRRDIRLVPVSSLRTVPTGQERVNAFQVQFAYSDRRVAQKVCADITRHLIDASVRWRSDESGSAKGLFEDEVARWRKRLAEIDQEIARQGPAGEPAQMAESQRRQWVKLESRVAELRRELSRARHEEELAAAREAVLRRQLATLPKEAPAAPSPQRVAAAREVELAEQRWSALRLRYRAGHPDVVDAQRLVEDARAALERLPREKAAAPAASREQAVLEAELAGVDAARASLVRQQSEYGRELAAREAELAAVPVGAAGEGAAARQLREERRGAQESLAKAVERANLAERHDQLVVRGHGERFDLLDPASLPEKATEPDRVWISFSGVGVGLLLGVLVAAVREMRDRSLKDVEEVQRRTGCTVLASVPLLENDLVVRRRLRLQWLAWTTASLAGAVLMGGSVVYHFSR